MPVPNTLPPTLLQSQQALIEARRKFGRILASWASDSLEVRRRRLNLVQWQAELKDSHHTKAA